MALTLAALTSFLAAHSTLTLATVAGDGGPGAASLFFAADEAARLYWVSTPSTRHSHSPTVANMARCHAPAAAGCSSISKGHSHALPQASQAVDALPEASCAELTDQRGVNRPAGANCDIGAYELGFVVTSLADAPDRNLSTLTCAILNRTQLN